MYKKNCQCTSMTYFGIIYLKTTRKVCEHTKFKTKSLLINSNKTSKLLKAFLYKKRNIETMCPENFKLQKPLLVFTLRFQFFINR